ncbi:polycomb group protein EMF2B-like [Cajanus cajan]|uniref:polycomb group protein EMF2B-like n=1 Tax=Cajanus cajan TaxID=3821 RepID=UPI00098DB055|nr:polycomb group protein EMF2B-like [Cajanus cajan]
MELEEVILDDDSEDEINEDAQEIQDRRKVSLLDATNDEKQFIPMWNAFVKKHRVLAEGHINWAFEAFTKYHCADIAQSPALTWRWKAFMIKLSNHGLLKARTLITCNILLEQYRKLNSDISQQLKKFQF